MQPPAKPVGTILINWSQLYVPQAAVLERAEVAVEAVEVADKLQPVPSEALPQQVAVVAAVQVVAAVEGVGLRQLQ